MIRRLLFFSMCVSGMFVGDLAAMMGPPRLEGIKRGRELLVYLRTIQNNTGKNIQVSDSAEFESRIFRIIGNSKWPHRFDHRLSPRAIGSSGIDNPNLYLVDADDSSGYPKNSPYACFDVIYDSKNNRLAFNLVPIYDNTAQQPIIKLVAMGPHNRFDISLILETIDFSKASIEVKSFVEE